MLQFSVQLRILPLGTSGEDNSPCKRENPMKTQAKL